MFGAVDRQISLRRSGAVLGWLLAALYFGALVLLNVGIVVDLYRPPEGPWPGSAPLIEADLLYGAGGIAVMLAARWGWRRLMGPRLNPVKLA